MRKTLATIGFACLISSGIAGTAAAAPLPDNCTMDQGTVTCETTTGPGKNQGGVGSTETTETQGNTTNKSPAESQDLQDDCEVSPPKSQGGFNTCP